MIACILVVFFYACAACVCGACFICAEQERAVLQAYISLHALVITQCCRIECRHLREVSAKGTFTLPIPVWLTCCLIVYPHCRVDLLPWLSGSVDPIPHTRLQSCAGMVLPGGSKRRCSGLCRVRLHAAQASAFMVYTYKCLHDVSIQMSS
jgi:hypothetical protein